MIEYKISYVVTTYNKLPYLKQVMERLVAARQPDEEIVVADGGSKDGSPAYLQGLFDAGLIQQYVSERDKGEAHGFNKCMLMAKGELIKYITDDDAFCYPAIREAAAFMLAHPEIDVLSANSGLLVLEDLSTIFLYEYNQRNFLRWYNEGAVIHLIGLPIIIRRSSLALTGLFHTGSVLVDAEFTFRITALNVNIAWSSAWLSVRLDNPQSNFRNFNAPQRDDEGIRMMFYYDKQYRNDTASILKQRIDFKEWFKKPIRPAKNAVYRMLNIPIWQPPKNPAFPTHHQPKPDDDLLDVAFRIADVYMTEYNGQHPTDFIFRTNEPTIAKALPSGN